jgi:hypothetical protein
MVKYSCYITCIPQILNKQNKKESMILIHEISVLLQEKQTNSDNQ